MNKEKVRIIQKLNGFLVAFEGNEATVCFIKNEECIEMVVPAKNLKRNKITKKDQPFEYIESEVFKNGCWYQCAAYKPLCLADDCTVASVKLSDESRKQMEEIIEENPDESLISKRLLQKEEGYKMKNCNSINTTGLRIIKNLETNQKGFLLYTIPNDYIGVVVYDENIDSGVTDTLGVESMIMIKDNDK